MNDQVLWQLGGWTMIHFLWIGTLATLAQAMVRLLLRRASANLRYATTLVGFLTLTVTPLAVAGWLAKEVDWSASPTQTAVVNPSPEQLVAEPPLALAEVAMEQPMVIDLAHTPIDVDLDAAAPSDAEPPVASDIEPLVTSTPVVAEMPVAAANDPIVAALSQVPIYLPWAWIVGTPMMFLLLATGLIGSDRIRRGAQVLTDGPVYETTRRLRTALRLGRDVAVGVSDRVLQPVLVGIVRPMILLPPAALAGWSPEELEMALLHELAHVRRHDNLVNVLQRFVESLLFFHPCVWLVSRWLRTDREQCCDAIVVRQTGAREAYADLLISVARDARSRRLPSTAVALSSHPLARRVRRILQLEDEEMLVSKRSVGLVALALVAFVALAMWQGRPESVADETSSELKSIEPRFDEGDEAVFAELESLDNEAIRRLFTPTSSSPLVTRKYDVNEEYEGQWESVFNKYASDPFGPQIKFDWRWIVDGQEMEITAPEPAHEEFIAPTIALMTKIKTDGEANDETATTEASTIQPRDNGEALLLDAVKRWNRGFGGALVVQRNERGRLQVLAPESAPLARLATVAAPAATLPFLSLEDQRIADLAYKMLDVEVTTTDAKQRAAVKEKGFAGGVAIESNRNTVGGFGGGELDQPLQSGDILVGLHVWETPNLESLGTVLRRDDLTEFNPIKYHVLREEVDAEALRKQQERRARGGRGGMGGEFGAEFGGGGEFGMMGGDEWEQGARLAGGEFGIGEFGGRGFGRRSSRDREEANSKPPTKLVLITGRMSFDQPAWQNEQQRLRRVEQERPDPGPSFRNTGIDPATGNEVGVPIERANRAANDRQLRERHARIADYRKEEIDSARAARDELKKAYDRFVSEAESKLAAEEAKLKAIDAKLSQAEVEYDRRQKLVKEGFESERALQKSEQAYKAAEAESKTARHSVLTARNALEGKKRERDSKQAEWTAKINKLLVEFEKARANALKVGKADAAGTLLVTPTGNNPEAMQGTVWVGSTSNSTESKPTLLYDGRTFEDWRTQWKNELKTENRTEAIKALRAFGRAGKGREATEAILDVAEEYNIQSYGGNDTPRGRLNTAIVSSFIDLNDSHPIQADVAVPLLLDRYKEKPKQYAMLLGWVLEHTNTSDPELWTRIAKLDNQDIGFLRTSVLQHLVRSDPTLSSDVALKVMQGYLKDDDEAVVRHALQELVDYGRYPGRARTAGRPMLRKLVPALTPLLFDDRPKIRGAARVPLQWADEKQATTIGNVLTAIVQGQDGPFDIGGGNFLASTDDPEVNRLRKLYAIRALAALGAKARVAEPTLLKLFEGDDYEAKVAAMAAIEQLYTNHQFGQFGIKSSVVEVPDTLLRDIERSVGIHDNEGYNQVAADKFHRALEKERGLLFYYRMNRGDLGGGLGGGGGGFGGRGGFRGGGVY